MRVAAVIPARRGSKGIKGKNWRDFCGKPLVRWSVEQALAAKGIDDVLVTSDAPEVMDAISGLRTWWIRRPDELCGDDVTTEAVLLHTLEVAPYPVDALVLLQPTSPIRTPEMIGKALSLLTEDHGAVVSTVKTHYYIYPCYERLRRQQLIQVTENGSIYVMRTKTFLEKQNRMCGITASYEMPPWTRFELDEEDDWAIAEMAMKEKVLAAV